MPMYVKRDFVKKKKNKKNKKEKKKKSKKGRKNSIIMIMLFMKEDTYVLLVDLPWMWFTYLKLMCIRDVV